LSKQDKNFIYALKESTASATPIFTEPEVAQRHDVFICYTEFYPKSVKKYDKPTEIHLRPSVWFSLYRFSRTSHLPHNISKELVSNFMKIHMI